MGIPVFLDGHRSLNCRMVLVVLQLEVFESEVEDGFGRAVDDQLGKRIRVARELFGDLLHVVVVDVRVTARPDELTDLESADVRNHVCQQCVAGDVEGHAQEHVSTALVQLARQLAIVHIELEQCMARLQLHARKVGWVPGAHQHSTRIGVRANGVDDVRDLVDGLATGRRPGHPLNAINRSEVAVLVGPLVPNGDAVFVQPLDVRVATKEPQQLDRHSLERHPLGCDQRETILQVVANLTTEYASRSGTGSISLVSAIFKDVTQQIFVRKCHCFS